MFPISQGKQENMEKSLTGGNRKLANILYFTLFPDSGDEYISFPL